MMFAARSLLFLPATRPDRLDPAMASGADVVCIDLEDSVATADKARAREQAADMLERAFGDGVPVGVRINAIGGEDWRDDLNAVLARAAFILLPKAEKSADVAAVPTGRPLVPLIETPEGMRNAWNVAEADGVGAVLFGAFDYSASVGCAMEWEPLLWARSRLAAACARAEVGLIDSPSGDLRDRDGLEASSRRARALGFTGRACIHPDQVAAVNAAFTPSEAEVAAARRQVDAFKHAGGGVAQLDGRLLEAPVVAMARRVLAAATR